MKKIVSAVAALGLVAGLATTASALDLSVTGSYQLIGATQSDALGAGNGVALVNTAAGVAAGNDSGSDSFYFHSFVMKPVLKVNDNVTVKSDIRLADRDVWGANGSMDAGDTIGASMTGTAASTGRIIDVRQIYMEYASPVGKFTVGRVPTSAWGGAFLDSASQGNRIIFAPSFMPEPFSLTLFTQKMTESDAATDSRGAGKGDSSSDIDGYYIGIGHKAEIGASSFALFHVRDNNNNKATGTLPATDTDVAVVQNNWWYYGKYKINNIGIEAELDYLTGDHTDNQAAANVANNLPATADRDALAAMLDVSGTFDALNVGALYFYASGQPRTFDATAAHNQVALAVNADREAALTQTAGTGNDYNPYLILTGDWTGILNGDKGNGNPAYADVQQAGVQSIGLHASYQVSPALSLSGAIGSAWADEEQRYGQDDSYGVEYDLNAAYKLLDNLTYSAHFGYLDTGDFFKGGVATNSLNSITFMAHAMTMNF